MAMYVGIDLGGAKGHTTASAFLRERRGRLTVEALELPFGDAELLNSLVEVRGSAAVVAIDAPLTLPACMRCDAAECPSPRLCKKRFVKGIALTGRTGM